MRERYTKNEEVKRKYVQPREFTVSTTNNCVVLSDESGQIVFQFGNLFFFVG